MAKSHAIKPYITNTLPASSERDDCNIRCGSNLISGLGGGVRGRGPQATTGGGGVGIESGPAFGRSDQ